MTTVITISLPLEMEGWTTESIITELKGRVRLRKAGKVYPVDGGYYLTKSIRVSKEFGEEVRELAKEEGLSILSLTKRLW